MREILLYCFYFFEYAELMVGSQAISPNGDSAIVFTKKVYCGKSFFDINIRIWAYTPKCMGEILLYKIYILLFGCGIMNQKQFLITTKISRNAFQRSFTGSCIHWQIRIKRFSP